MEEFQITGVRQVRELSGQSAVNALLGLGWVLLGTSHGKDEMNYPIVRYTLGWTQDCKAPEPV